MADGHPYVPNSVPEVRAEMLREIGVDSVDDLYAAIPERLRFQGLLDLPAAISSEYRLKRHLEGLLARNESSARTLSFLGGGCWQHHVPAVCDEVNQRGEFLTAYSGEMYTDHGKYQAFFEYASLVGELVEMDAVTLPTFDWATAASTALKMAARITGRSEVVLPRTVGPERLATIRNHCRSDLELRVHGFDARTGLVELDELRELVSERTAAVYYENPSYLGVLDDRGASISELAHEHGALSVVGVDPISLGVLAPPSAYGADLVCGELQPLGIHPHYGGGLSGFIASSDDARFVSEYPTFLFGLTPTAVESEYGFGYVDWERTSYVKRGDAEDFGGTTTALWSITAAVYLSTLGPRGLAELGQGILQRSQYAAALLGELPGVRAPALEAPFFKELVVRFEDRSVDDVNRALRAHGIFGGHSLARDFPELGESALYCVTEIHTKDDLDRLADALAGAL